MAETLSDEGVWSRWMIPASRVDPQLQGGRLCEPMRSGVPAVDENKKRRIGEKRVEVDRRAGFKLHSMRFAAVVQTAWV
jgi:hypothetical protein